MEVKGFVTLINLALVLAFSTATLSKQDLTDLDSVAKERIEQARASTVIVKRVDQDGKVISQARGFFVRKDLVATDMELDRNSRVQVISVARADTVRVLYPGHYVLPYVLVETQAGVSPVSIGDSEQVGLNDSVYMFDDAGKIVSGTVTSTTVIKNSHAFLMSLPVDSNNNGAPVFNRHGEVIGIAAKSPDGQSAGLAWPSDLLATLKHLGEPGIGVGAGDGPRFGIKPPPSNSDVSSPDKVDTKPVRLSGPSARYTEAARANSTQGSVLLRVLVSADGNVNGVRVIRGLPDGLTEQAIEVAKQTKFKPAMKDGKPVAYLVALEINFTIR